ncbi:MAG: alpha/beta hydrolase [Clostridiales bacterium]|nr:alpha/beta hydrolase [Clostridiales bacterium]
MIKMDETLFEFAEVPLKESLESFFEDHKIKVFEKNNHNLEYYDAGDSEVLIMMLPSSNGNAVTFFRYIQTFSERFRVVVPNYEAGVDLKTQCEGFLELARSIPHKKLILFGYSFGGVIAQLMTKLSPNDIDKLILLDSETKTEHINPILVKKFVKSYKRLNRTLKYFSVKWMHKSLKKRIAFDAKIGLDENQHFWEALYTQVLLETSKDRMRLIYDNVREFWSDYELCSADFDTYKGKILILNVEGSKQRVEVQELSHLFKQADIKNYDKGFRMSLVTCYNNVISDVTDFSNL